MLLTYKATAAFSHYEKADLVFLKFTLFKLIVERKLRGSIDFLFVSVAYSGGIQVFTLALLNSS